MQNTGPGDRLGEGEVLAGAVSPTALMIEKVADSTDPEPFPNPRMTGDGIGAPPVTRRVILRRAAAR